MINSITTDNNNDDDNTTASTTIATTITAISNKSNNNSNKWINNVITIITIIIKMKSGCALRIKSSFIYCLPHYPENAKYLQFDWLKQLANF